MKHIIITGATGAIGMALIKKCIGENTAVTVICHRGSSRLDLLPKHPLVKILQADLDELGTLQTDSEEGCDAFYHFAWEGTYGTSRNDMELQTKNIRYTLDAVRLAKRLGCKTFIGAGSQAEYGPAEGVLRPDTPAFPQTGYGMAKLCAGQMSRELCTELGIRHIWARILSVYGPYDKEYTMVMSTIQKMLQNEKTAFTKAEQIWDYLYSGDAAQMLYLLAIKGQDGKVYCLGSGQARPLQEYIRIMQKLTNTKAEPDIGALPYAKGQVMHLEADLTDVIRDTGYRPQTSFEDGVSSIIKYYENISVHGTEGQG